MLCSDKFSLVLLLTCRVTTSMAWQPPPAWILPVGLALSLCAECSDALAMSNLTCFFMCHKGPALCAWHPEDVQLWCQDVQLWYHHTSMVGSLHRLGAGADAAGLRQREKEQIQAWYCGVEPRSSPFAMLWVEFDVDE